MTSTRDDLRHAPEPGSRSVALVTLGCARNDVDSSELAGRLAGAGWTLVDDVADADVAVVNTCGFVDQAKKDSVDALLEAADHKDGTHRTKAVVAVGCLAERYGAELADSLPEADAVLGFDAYPDLAEHLSDILGGHAPAPHVPRDRRTLLPVSPVQRQGVAQHPPGHAAVTQAGPDLPAHGIPASGPVPVRRVLDGRACVPVKLASGCDRRCSFCAIPAFRGAFLSRPPHEIVEETRWLAGRGVSEVFLVSENSTSYGKDLSDLRALESLLPQLAQVPGIERVRVSYLQPAEVRPGLIEVIAGTPKVADYFDLSFQHSAAGVLRRMRRFGDTASFLGLIDQIRDLAPNAGIRTNVIVGFPGESEADLAELHDFLRRARLDVVGVFGYSDEEGTEAVGLDGHLDPDEIEDRAALTRDLVEQLMAERAEDRIGQPVRVLVEEVDEDGHPVGRAEHQGPEVDGVTTLLDCDAGPGAWVDATVVAAEGVDLVARS